MTIVCPVIDVDAMIAKAVRLLALDAVYHLVVVDKSNSVLGVISSRDLARNLLELYEGEGLVEERVLKKWLSTTISTLMTKPVIVVREDPGPQQAAKIMTINNIGILPVVDEKSRLVKCYEEALTTIYVIGDQRPAVRYATHGLITLEKDYTVIEAIGVMIEHGIRHLVDPKNYRIITINDLLLHAVRRSKEEVLLEQVDDLLRPATVVNEALTIGEVAELLTLLPERAILIKMNKEEELRIITCRDLLRVLAEARV